MSLLTIAQSVATNVSIPAPNTVLSDLTDDNNKIVQFSIAAAEEIARRVDWGALRKTVTITGTGSNDNFGLPNDFSRLIPGNAIMANGAPVRVGLSSDEWNSLTAVQGVPRYAYLGAGIAFYPFPALAATVSITYQSKNWASSNGTTWATDSDAALFPEVLIEKGTIWRWRRQMGQDYQDYLAEFEAALSDYAKFDDGMRQP